MNNNELSNILNRKNGAIYIRVSTDRQEELSPDAQRRLLLEYAKEHPIDTIIVWKVSRFTRNQEESIVYKSLLKKNDIDVVSISEPLMDGPFGSLSGMTHQKWCIVQQKLFLSYRLNFAII